MSLVSNMLNNICFSSNLFKKKISTINDYFFNQKVCIFLLIFGPEPTNNFTLWFLFDNNLYQKIK